MRTFPSDLLAFAVSWLASAHCAANPSKTTEYQTEGEWMQVIMSDHTLRLTVSGLQDLGNGYTLMVDFATPRAGIDGGINATPSKLQPEALDFELAWGAICIRDQPCDNQRNFVIEISYGSEVLCRSEFSSRDAHFGIIHYAVYPAPDGCFIKQVSR